MGSQRLRHDLATEQQKAWMHAEKSQVNTGREGCCLQVRKRALPRTLTCLYPHLRLPASRTVRKVTSAVSTTQSMAAPADGDINSRKSSSHLIIPLIAFVLLSSLTKHLSDGPPTCLYFLLPVPWKIFSHTATQVLTCRLKASPFLPFKVTREDSVSCR